MWTAHKTSNKPRYENNFRKTNRSSLRTVKATTARAQTAFRRTKKDLLPRFDLTISEKPMYLPEDAHPYGKANRPGTPVGDVVSNYYGQDAAKDIGMKYEILSSKRPPNVG